MFFASLPVCLPARRAGDVRPAALLPMAAQTGDQSCRLGWAGRVGGGEGDPAGVWLRSNPGDYYRWDTHTYTHTSAGICCWRQS